MTLSLRHRLILTIVPLLGATAALGIVGLGLLHQLGGRIDVILRENYDSVVAMVGLNEALDRIDSSHQFALAGQFDAEAYRRYWEDYDRNLTIERGNITLPDEGEHVARLVELTKLYRAEGRRFVEANPPDAAAYFGPQGLLTQFRAIKAEADAIRQLNQDHMKSASDDARRTAYASRMWFALGLLVAGVIAGLAAWRTVGAVLGPVRELTRSATGIGEGNLNRVVPVYGTDELGQLARSFNRMTEQLRTYRQSTSAQLERTRLASQAAIDAFPDAVLVLDPEGAMAMANPAARTLLGLPAPGSPWSPPEALARPLAEALRERRPFLPETFDQTLDYQSAGETRTFLPRILPIRDEAGAALGVAVVLSDVTRFRLLDRMKSDLVATASHELKTPLTSVRLVLHLMLEETVGPLTPKQAELLLDARDNAERLLHTIEQLLALARLERGGVDLQPHSAADLLRAASDRIAPRAESKNVTVGLELAPDLPRLAANPERLGVALDNLLNNALTYTPPGGRIALSADAPDPDHVRLRIADTGVGIPPEYLPHLFERFLRIPGQSDEGGTGLGLSIVREIATAHGGEVSCVSEPGRGTTFALVLPAWKEARS